MSDRELSDIGAFISAPPPVDAETPPVVVGPMGQILQASGRFPLRAARVLDLHAPHRAAPPPAGPTVGFGEHLAAVCAGCHGTDISGGPIAAGPPDRPPAANLTPHTDGLAGWSQDELICSLREGVAADGRRLPPPLDSVCALARTMADVELEAVWRTLDSLPPVPGG